jgi:four helix bundle protein
MEYDLEERCAIFGEKIISFLRALPKQKLTEPLLLQLVRSATSSGANYMEANQASSKKDFRNKITICRKEASETKYWLRMMMSVYAEQGEDIRLLSKEAHELTLIFNKIVRSCDSPRPQSSE